MRENLTEEESAIFDILTRPGPELGAAEQSEEELDALLEAYTRTIFSEKCSWVFEHVYEARAG